MASSTVEMRMYSSPPAANRSSLSCQRRPRFNAIVTKFGFKLEDKKIVQLGQGTDQEEELIINAPKKTIQPAHAKKPASTRKRKVSEADDEEMNQNKEDSEAEADATSDGGAEMI